MIELQGVSRRFGDQDAVRDVTLTIPRGSLFAFIGPSGSGKTTLIRLLDLLERPTAGRYLFDGIGTGGSEQERLAIRRRIAMVFQKPVPLATTVRGNVATGLRFRKVPDSEIEVRVTHALEMVSLAHLAERDAATLSGGEMQRVALARALVTEPEVLLLDEPTANLDPENTALIEEIILKTNRERETTIVLSTHDLEQGQRLAGSLGLLMHGRLHQAGNPGDVLFHPSTRAAARFVGVENLLPGRIDGKDGDLTHISVAGNRVEAITDGSPGDEIVVCLRAEDLILSASSVQESSARNSLAGTITRIALHGSFARITVDAGYPLTALITRRSADEMGLQEGQPIRVTFKATAVHVIREAGHSQPAAG